MWIECENDGTRALAPEGVDWENRAIFNEDGVAQVKADVGQKLIDQFDSVHERDADSEDSDDDSQVSDT